MRAGEAAGWWRGRSALTPPAAGCVESFRPPTHLACTYAQPQGRTPKTLHRSSVAAREQKTKTTPRTPQERISNVSWGSDHKTLAHL
eukprot:7983137-Pyramimonas_sp.AAC.1